MQIRSIQVPCKSLPSFMVSSELGSDEQPTGNSQGASADQEGGHFTVDASSDEEDSGSMASLHLLCGINTVSQCLGFGRLAGFECEGAVVQAMLASCGQTDPGASENLLLNHTCRIHWHRDPLVKCRLILLGFLK